jgi:hypothetical protein
MAPEPKRPLAEDRATSLAFPLAIGAAVVILFSFRLYVTTHRTLTPFEGTISDLFLLFLAIAFTWLLAKRDEERSILANQKKLARSALRRVTGIGESAERLLANLSQARREFTSDTVWRDLDEPRRRLLLEILNTLTQQVSQMRETVDESAEDWGEILPDELAKIKAARERILEQVKEAFNAVTAETDRLKKLVQEGQLKADQLKHMIEERTAGIENKTRLEIERIRSEIRPFGLGTSSLSVLAPSASGLLTGERLYGLAAPETFDDAFKSIFARGKAPEPTTSQAQREPKKKETK